MIWDTLLQIPAPQMIAFLSAGVMLNLAPGADVMFATASGLQGGPRAGVQAAIGITLGVMFYVVALTLGLGAVVAAHPGLLTVIRYAGAGWLVWLAYRAWTAPPPAPHPLAPSAQHGRGIVGRAMLANLMNPKPPLFLLSFLPQFTDPALGPVWRQFLALGVLFCATGLVITAGYGIAAGWAGLHLKARLRILNRIAAAMFLGLAARMLRG